VPEPPHKTTGIIVGGFWVKSFDMIQMYKMLKKKGLKENEELEQLIPI